MVYVNERDNESSVSKRLSLSWDSQGACRENPVRLHDREDRRFWQTYLHASSGDCMKTVCTEAVTSSLRAAPQIQHIGVTSNVL